MRNTIKQCVVTLIIVLALPLGSALADEWVASKLRGAVFVYENAQWQQIYRGHIVDSANAIQTAPHSRVVFTRGKESIDVRGDTRIRIKDRVGQLDTVVEQDFGEITVDVEKKNVQHFAVEAPLLTAVVKGTKFTVKANKDGAAAEVQVRRGRVEVHDVQRKVKVDVKQGQKASRNAGAAGIVEVKGRGTIEPIISMTTNQPVVPKQNKLSGKVDLTKKINNDAVNNPNGSDSPSHSNAGGNNNPGKNNSGNSESHPSGTPDHSNGGGNGKGNSTNSGKGPPDHSNAGGNGKGSGSDKDKGKNKDKGKGKGKDDDEDD